MSNVSHERLAARNHDVHVLSCVWPWPSPQDRLEDGVWVHRRQLSKIKGLWRITPKTFQTRDRIILGLSNFVSARKLGIAFDVVEYPEWGAEGWLLSLFRRFPAVAHLHTGLTIASRYAGNRSIRRDVRLGCGLERISVQRADVVTTGSELLAKDMCAAGWLPESSMRIIPCPIELGRWAAPTPASETPPEVLFCGRIEERKAPEILVDAINLLKSEIPNIKGRFVGYYNADESGGPRMEWTQKRCLDNCTFEGQLSRDKTAQAIHASRVSVQASHYESFGLATAEAMAAGRPVLVTSTTGVARFVREAQAGTIIPPGDASALASALRPYLKDRLYAAETGKCGRLAVMREMDASKIAALREEVYYDAIASFAAHSHSRGLLNRRRPQIYAAQSARG